MASNTHTHTHKYEKKKLYKLKKKCGKVNKIWIEFWSNGERPKFHHKARFSIISNEFIVWMNLKAFTDSFCSRKREEAMSKWIKNKKWFDWI